MIGLILFLAWVAAGVAASATQPIGNDSRWAWTPIAAIFGPLWFCIAEEQRSDARRTMVAASV